MNIQDMQKIWDTESNQTLYVLDEASVLNRINRKVISTERRANRTENFIIAINVFVTIVLFVIAILNNKLGTWEYLMALFAAITIGFVLYYRKKRHEFQSQIGDKMLDNLNKAIHHATIQAKMTDLFLIWYIIGVSVLTISNMFIQNISIWFILPIALVMLIGFIVGRWEQRSIHEKKRDELIDLRAKLVEEVDK
jgi:membrane protein implicated in regulation of membrane protease activity